MTGFGSKTVSKFLTRICRVAALCLTFASVLMPGVAGGDGPSGRPEWKTGFWLWQSYSGQYQLPERAAPPVDLLYVQVDEFSDSSGNGCPIVSSWPGTLPAASAYFAVWRFAGMQPPGPEVIPELTKAYLDLKARASRSGQNLVGLQLDFDCPTSQLEEYGRFLRTLRKALPEHELLSITALLDWFRPETRIADVVHAVDEFVPQFYDVGSDGWQKELPGIAKAVDPVRWAGVFNAFERPYRIGISSFGRIAIDCRDDKAPLSASRRSYFRDMNPLELMNNKELIPVAEQTNAAGESVLHFRVNPRITEYRRYCLCSEKTESLEMILPSKQSVSQAYVAAQAMGGWCRGVVFFRWPLINEALALTPAEIQRLTAGKELIADESLVEVEDGFCAATTCSDLFLRLKDRFPRKPVTLSIGSSVALEYFLPGGQTQAQLNGPRSIAVSIPAYAGLPRIYLGRAVTREPATFLIQGKGR